MSVVYYLFIILLFYCAIFRDCNHQTNSTERNYQKNFVLNAKVLSGSLFCLWSRKANSGWNLSDESCWWDLSGRQGRVGRRSVPCGWGRTYQAHRALRPEGLCEYMYFWPSLPFSFTTTLWFSLASRHLALSTTWHSVNPPLLQLQFLLWQLIRQFARHLLEYPAIALLPPIMEAMLGMMPWESCTVSSWRDSGVFRVELIWNQKIWRASKASQVYLSWICGSEV